MPEDASKTPGEGLDPNQWVDLHGDILFRFALARVRGPELAEELVQEALLAAFRARKSFAGRSSERTWLVQILKNKIVDHYRRRKREVPATDIVSDGDGTDELFNRKGGWDRRPGSWRPNPEELLQSSEFLQVLDSCMDELPEHQSQVFSLRVLDGQKGDAVCNLLDLTATNVGVLLHRARLRLRRCLELRWFEADPGEAS